MTFRLATVRGRVGLVDGDAWFDLERATDGAGGRDIAAADMFFGVPALIEYLSSILTLAPGDVVFTGTPAGVGMATGTSLRPGDVITTSIEEVGSFTTRCT